MGLNFFRKKSKKNKFLVLDIGTEAVKALIFSTSAEGREKVNKKIIILGSSIQYFEKYGVFNSRDFEIDVIKEAVLKVIERAYQSFILFSEKKDKKGKQDWKKWPILLGLPPNILKSRIVWQSLKREKPKEKISKVEQKLICQKCFREAQKEISQRLTREFGILPEDIQWITQKILKIEIDGYPVPEIQGYEGKDLKFKVLVTFLPKHYSENIKKIFKELQLNILKIVHIAENLPFTFSGKKVKGLPIIFEDKVTDAIFIDVGGETTQIFLIKTGSLYQVAEFGKGGKAFSQRLSEILGLEEESARNLKERYSNKLLSIEAVKRVKEIFLEEKKVWYENLKIRIKKIGPKALLPPTVFLFGGGSLLPEIQEVLQENGEVKFISPKDLKDIEDPIKKIKSPQYIPSLLISYYAP